jgi:hypothetical protein
MGLSQHPYCVTSVLEVRYKILKQFSVSQDLRSSRSSETLVSDRNTTRYHNLEDLDRKFTMYFCVVFVLLSVCITDLTGSS